MFKRLMVVLKISVNNVELIKWDRSDNHPNFPTMLNNETLTDTMLCDHNLYL